MRNMIFSAIMAGAALTAYLPAGAQAAIPITVQGTVQNNGNPLTGLQSMTFRIYDAATGGSVYWTESQTVTFTNGVYSATLGNSTSLAGVFPDATSQRWLSVQIGVNPEFSPRQRLTATPYANFSAGAANSNALSGQNLGYFIPRSQAVMDNAETLSVLRGTVAANGAVSAGSGFTCTRTSAGNYSVTVNAAQEFGGPFSIVATPETSNVLLSAVYGSTTAFTVSATDRANGTALDSAFHFIAIGTRLPFNGVDADGDGVAVFPSGLDCNDNDPNVYPGAPEQCNNADDNCDGNVDEGVSTTYYADVDTDGYGNAAQSVTACIQPSGYVANNLDCDDNDPMVSPAGTEICNSVDDDCNGTIDDIKYYLDQDSDTYGDASDWVISTGCTPPLGRVTDNTDCNDSDALVNPGATEACGNSSDDDCDGGIDEGC